MLVPDREDAAMERDEDSPSETPIDCAPIDVECDQLPPRDHAVLPVRQRDDRITAGFASHTEARAAAIGGFAPAAVG